MRALTLTTTGAICALALVTAGFSADAAETGATYYAAPNATRTSGCTRSEPCTLAGALSSAKAGSTVQLESGTYPVSTPLSVSTAVVIHGATGPAMPEVLGVLTLTKDLLALSGGASISAVRLRSEAPGRDALDLNGATGDQLILEEAASAPAKGGHPPAAADLVASSSGTVLRDSVAWGSGTGTEGVIARSGKSPSASESIALVNDTLIGTGTTGNGLLSEQAAGTDTVLNTVLAGAAGDVVAAPSGIVRIEASDFNPAHSSGYTGGAGNLAAGALFVDAAAGDFRELAGSPTIDGGMRSASIGPSDPDGKPRTLGSAPDIGAYEYLPLGSITPGSTTTPTGTPGPSTGTSGPNTPTAPVIGRLAGVERVSGRVLVRTPPSPSFTALSGASTVPMGSVIDARRGVVRVTTALAGHGRKQSLRVWGGLFQVNQSSRGSGMTRITLTGALGSCARHARAATSAASNHRPKMRRLWARDSHGQYSTYGNNSVATVRGTEWETIDTCAGTLTRVVRGRISLRDLRRHRTVLVRAGHSYLARP